MNKKGVFFTITAIALTLVIIATYKTLSGPALTGRMDTIQTRIDTINLFIRNVELDLEKGAYIASFRTLLNFDQYISTNGSYIPDVNQNFKESFLNGTLNGKVSTIMQNSTFLEWGRRISIQADKIDINFNFTVNEINISQSDPWWIDVNVNISLLISDQKNTSSWNRENVVSTRIPIVGLEDPLYIISTDGKVPNLIIVENRTPFVINSDPANLASHANNSYYVAHNDSPSFLMRLEGSLNGSNVGIESLVNLKRLESQDLPIRDSSVVDYIYFGSTTTTNYRINRTPSWFKLDSGHLAFYGAENITCTSDCINT